MYLSIFLTFAVFLHRPTVRRDIPSALPRRNINNPRDYGSFNCDADVTFTRRMPI